MLLVLLAGLWRSPMTPTRGHNLHLRALHTEAAWTLQAMAHAVNTVGTEAGVRLHYDRTSVSHWMAGRQPGTGVADIVAEALSRRLRRPVTPGDIGLIAQDAPTAGVDPVSALAELALADCDPTQRVQLRRGIYQLHDTLAMPRTALTPHRHLPTHTRRIGAGETEAARAMIAALAHVYLAHGGGRARAALIAYVAQDITRLLTTISPNSAGRSFTSAAAGLVYLAGFMALDARSHRLAQRYFTLALALAEDAHDIATQALALRAVGLQAHILGHHHAALHAIQAAEDTARPTAPPHMKALLAGQAAVEYAALGDKHEALATLARTDRLFARATPPAGPLGTYSPADLHHDAGLALHYLHDNIPARHAINLSLDQRPPEQRLLRALTTAWATQMHVQLGHLHSAHALLEQLRHDCHLLQSQRARYALAEMTRRVVATAGSIARQSPSIPQKTGL
ncbi:hypothetical protein [Longispora urticae]